LKPAPAPALAREIALLAGGANKLADRARTLADHGDLRVAGHLAELAVQAEPENVEVHKVRIAVNQKRAAIERTTMARGVFDAATRESQAVADPEALATRPRRNIGLG
jgi:alkyl sulfatase BDS1-like metallo-beta-lactamase superfamily hydrolase